ncbi:MAG: hypothetical protein H0V20_02120 [Actinobacteria bacterium]|nr:hypothetical protein [Actinomycetota bacterium]
MGVQTGVNQAMRDRERYTELGGTDVEAVIATKAPTERTFNAAIDDAVSRASRVWRRASLGEETLKLVLYRHGGGSAQVRTTLRPTRWR